MRLVNCQTCHYYFPHHKIRQHQKLCTILYQITGNRNNSKIISQLSPNTQGKIIRYYSNDFSSSGNTSVTLTFRLNTPPRIEQ